MKIGIVGCDSITHDDARLFAQQYLAELRLKYKSLRVVTVRGDILGRHIRSVARSLNIRRKTFGRAAHEDQHNANELSVGQMMWSCDKLILFDDEHVGLSTIAQEIGQRMSKPMTIIGVGQ